MNKRFCVLACAILLLLALWPAIVWAAPETAVITTDATRMAESRSVILPGWLGGLLAFISILLPLLTWGWIRKRQ